MSTKSYQEVMKSLTKEQIDTDYENIPPEMGAFREPPQPGAFRFKAPQGIENCFDIIEVTQRDAEGKAIIGADKKPQTYQRVSINFEGGNELTIIQSPSQKYNDEPFRTRISNIERKRFVAKGQFVKVSDLTYLFRALTPESKPKTNQEFIELALKVLPGAEFGADVEWSGSCNPERDAFFAFEDPNSGETIYEAYKEEGQTENKKGCGKRIFSNKWPKADGGGYAERAQCECGAWLRPFASLARFKA